MRCDFILPNNSFACGINFQNEMIHFVNPLQKNPFVYYVCGIHAKIRFDAFNRSDEELKKLYDKHEINYQQRRERQTEIWFRCRKCNQPFEKFDVIWVVTYFKFRSDVQLQVKKAFRIHRDCCLGELTLYGHGKEVDKDKKLDIFS